MPKRYRKNNYMSTELGWYRCSRCKQCYVYFVKSAYPRCLNCFAKTELMLVYGGKNIDANEC